MANILAIDDEEEILKLIETALLREGHRVVSVSKPSLFPIERYDQFDLIILDVMMPDIDGFSLCRKIRDLVDAPIIFLSAKTMEADLIQGLGVGADDYLKKPFGLLELRARVKAHLRREQREKKHSYALSGFSFKMAAKEVYADGEKIPLTKSEYEISEFLALHHGQVFSKEQIYESVFGYMGQSDASTIAEHIKNIRFKFSKLKKNPIETVWGIGYRWN